ncbi:MAG: hypothetical protein AAF492_00345 [Verrucomicrobiota bacterium]
MMKHVRIHWAVALGFSWALLCPAAETIGKGETPETFYRMFHEAKQQLDTHAILKLSSRRAALKEDGLYERLMRERSALPDKIEFLIKKSEKRVAQALFRGTRRDRETGRLVTSRGTVQFLREDGAWRIYKEKWEDVKKEHHVPSSEDFDRHLPPLVPEEFRLSKPEKKKKKGASSP